MDFPKVFQLLLEKFNEKQVRFALIGGFALHAAGHTRTTDDIDFLVFQEDVAKIKAIMLSLGYELVHESEDVANYLGPAKPLGGVDFLYARRKYTRAMLERAKAQKVLDDRFQVKVILPEDLIGLKVQSSSNDPKRHHQDLADIEILLRIHRNHLDLNLVQEYFDLFDRREELKAILRRI
ncbi:MAG: nucleotidyltransferase family protein [Candidatus Omnitrophica bacterium]|nr:nucleotidyltransferase family protein [Candidatus Omnitrophota bacterium]